MQAMQRTRLSDDAILVLIQANTGLPKGTIKAVLKSLNNLERTWLKAPPNGWPPRA
jgi:hypothetical protein